jgi:hypothetical protein
VTTNPQLKHFFLKCGICFARLADPEHHREATTSRPLLLQAIARQTTRAGRTTLTVTSTHGNHHRASQALTQIAAFFAELRNNAEQLTALDRWCRILSQALVSQALVKFLRGRKLVPPPRPPAGVTPLAMIEPIVEKAKSIRLNSRI